MTKTMAILLAVAVSQAVVPQQNKPTQDEIRQWLANPIPIPQMRCKQITWLLSLEEGVKGDDKQISLQMAWWTRGYVEGSVDVLRAQNPALDKKMYEFGLNNDVALAHLSAYCLAHPDSTGKQSAADLVMKVIK